MMSATEAASAASYSKDLKEQRESHMISEKLLKRIALGLVLMLAAYLVGYVPSWLTANGYKHERDQLASELKTAEVHRHLAAAALYASNGKYEEAFPAASQFFDSIRTEYESAESSFDGNAKQKLEKMLAQRDEVVAGLARGEPSAAQTLSSWFFEFEEFTQAASDEVMKGDKESDLYERG